MTPKNLLGRYTILRELGRDAIGTVYAARDQANGTMVALQTLDPALLGAADAALPEVFLKNARAAARLRHANIVRVHDAGEAGGTAYVASELVEGESLRQLLDERPLPIARAIRIFDDIASALAYAHEQGMVHRGVRPSNIVVLPTGVARIGDFGIGQIGEEALRYLSPEQVRGGAVDHRTDLYSLGVVFYEMLTRRAPFGGNSPKEIRDNILRAEPRRPSEVNPHVPAALDHMVLGMLARDPDDRVASARLLLRDLQRLEEALGLRNGASAGVRAPEPIRARTPEPIQDPPRFSAIDEHDEKVMRPRAPQPKPRSRSPSTVLSVFALALCVLSIGLTVLPHYAPDVRPEAPKTSAKPTPPPQTERMPAPLAQPPTVNIPESHAESHTEPPPAATAKLIVAVSPQGEIYVDGKHSGTTPPITTLDLEPGMHRIEIRSGSRRPYLTYMTVEPGDERRIRHDFNAKPMRPPV
jgi:serine/threonine-protein kinase